ncbi:hypothetical protein A3A39_02065 [Candidatus Kaiserbacteria bacterium RIFCSPLOWO2_01_FULL_54_13]|uniref:CARDB domain-containing protein n=1 Tax=Candidatus Kaiserbacteria bacterium RIFCSPLOWO2_01_FULL_54_13 TaxID=1798512 RepID=A0A1F6F160_9BACT|nr:MAG: hypothetical protein A3A39_02065 [Candidatus Kaiserbacteria bacterium RIFCSPLOWO2_01_FULL_54_13]
MPEPQQSASRTPYTVPEEPKASLASNILAIVGFIILIVVVIWGLVHLASISRGWFSSFFGGSDTVIEVSAPESATSGIPFSVSWKYDEPTSGTYALLYRCESGLAFQTPAPSGNIMNGIPCGAAFTVSGEEKRVSVTPFLSGNSALDIPISIIFMPGLPAATSTAQAGATGTRAQGSATVKISPVSAPAPTPSPTTPTTPTPAPLTPPSPTPAPTPAPTSRPSTPADLSVYIISASTDASGQGVVTFDIANVGGTRSGTYYFTAQLPTVSGYTYSSPAQTSLTPGSHVVNTLRFSQGRSGVVSISIATPDANGSNNYASQSVNAPYPYGTYNYLPTGQAGNYSYQAQYSSVSYPYTYPQYPYQTYPYNYQYQTYPSNYNQYPYTSQYPYSQQYPYSAYYPYAY